MARQVRVWRMPVALACLSTLGLASALLVDGWGDTLSWLALAVPVLVVCWHSLKSSSE